MATKFPKAYSQYGSSMGRRDNITEVTFPVKFHLERVLLDSGGYDNGGAYWGNGCGWLYYAHGDGAEEVQEMFFRAHNRDDAKTQVRAAFPNCTFYR